MQTIESSHIFGVLKCSEKDLESLSKDINFQNLKKLLPKWKNVNKVERVQKEKLLKEKETHDEKEAKPKENYRKTNRFSTFITSYPDFVQYPTILSQVEKSFLNCLTETNQDRLPPITLIYDSPGNGKLTLYQFFFVT
jgi:hypothetical protein